VTGDALAIGRYVRLNRQCECYSESTERPTRETTDEVEYLAMNPILVRVDQFVKLRTCLMCHAPGAYQYQQNESKFVDLSRLSRQKTFINGLRGAPGAQINIANYSFQIWTEFKNIESIYCNILQYLHKSTPILAIYWSQKSLQILMIQ